ASNSTHARRGVSSTTLDLAFLSEALVFRSSPLAATLPGTRYPPGWLGTAQLRALFRRPAPQAGPEPPPDATLTGLPCARVDVISGMSPSNVKPFVWPEISSPM